MIVGHTVFEDISTFYDGRVIGVNVDNKKNREKGKGRALLVEKGVYYVVGDKGKMRKLFSAVSLRPAVLWDSLGQLRAGL